MRYSCTHMETVRVTGLMYCSIP